MGFRERLERRLEAGKFRILNEKINREPGLVPEEGLFSAYHRGFQHQAKKWPERPLDMIKKRLRRDEVVADMGCGEAELSKEHPLAVSFDLHPTNGRGIQCDIRNVPMRDESADAVVFCLSLMFSDACEAIREGNRVLRRGGRLLIAEASSRVGDLRAFVQSIECLGFQALGMQTNGYFVFAELEKVGKSECFCGVLLKPSVYKRR